MESPPLPPGSPPVIRPHSAERDQPRRVRSSLSQPLSTLRVRALSAESLVVPGDKEEDLDSLMDQVLNLGQPERSERNEVGRNAIGASKNAQRLLSSSTTDAEPLQKGPLTAQALRPMSPDGDRSPNPSPKSAGTGSWQLKFRPRSPSPDPDGRPQPGAEVQSSAEPGDLAKLVMQAYVAINVAPVYGQIPESLGISHVLRIFSGSIAQGTQVKELQWLASEPELFRLTLKAFRYALKIAIDCVAMGDDLSDMEYFTMDRESAELDSEWFLGSEGSDKWAVAMRRRVPHLMALRKKGSSEVQVLRLQLKEDSVRIARLRPSVLQSLWASAAFELRYLANDDDERYSIQAHPTLFRNLVVQSAEYPIYVSPPRTVWL